VDFVNDDQDNIEFDSYLVPEEDLEDGALRMLEVDNRIILPEVTLVRFILTSADVRYAGFSYKMWCLSWKIKPGISAGE